MGFPLNHGLTFAKRPQLGVNLCRAGLTLAHGKGHYRCNQTDQTPGPHFMSRASFFLITLLALLVAGGVGLVMLADSTKPPQRQVEQTVPDERLPK